MAPDEARHDRPMIEQQHGAHAIATAPNASAS
jgi:hypothetical protein